MTDPITLALGAGFLASGALTIWATWSRGLVVKQRDEARDEAATFKAHYEDRYRQWSAECEKARRADARARAANHERNEATALFNRYRAAEPARIEAAIVANRLAHLKRISVLGNQSAKRRKLEG